MIKWLIALCLGVMGVTIVMMVYFPTLTKFLFDSMVFSVCVIYLVFSKDPRRAREDALLNQEGREGVNLDGSSGSRKLGRNDISDSSVVQYQFFLFTASYNLIFLVLKMAKVDSASPWHIVGFTVLLVFIVGFIKR